VKELDGIEMPFCDEHPLRIPGDQGSALDPEVVREAGSSVFVAEIVTVT